MTVKLSTANKVVITDDKDRWLGTFFFDNDTGTICIRGVFGDVAHSWRMSGRGTDLLTGFLKHCDISYLLDKFSYGRKDLSHWFDDEQTMKQVRKDIEESLLNRGDKRNCLSELENLGYCRTITDWQWSISTQCEMIYENLYQANMLDIPCITGYEPAYKRFFQEVWPKFVEFINSHPDLAHDGPRYTETKAVKQ